VVVQVHVEKQIGLQEQRKYLSIFAATNWMGEEKIYTPLIVGGN